MRSPGNNVKTEKRKSSRTEPWDTPMFRDQRDEKESQRRLETLAGGIKIKTGPVASWTIKHFF